MHTLTQNARGLPERSTDAYGTTKFLDDAYDYDGNGNVAAISDGATGRNQRGNRDMSYDGLDRLTTVVSPMYEPTGAAYGYDSLDNLTRVILSDRNHYYCYDASNRLTNVKTGGCGSGATVVGLGYDVQGNLNNKNGVLYGFDQANRLRNVGPSPASSYVYDGQGRRVRDTVAGGSKYSQYTLSGQLAMTSDARAGTVDEYVYLAGSLLAIRERDTATNTYTVRYQHTDALGSPVVVTNGARVALEPTHEYEPYGRQLTPVPKDGPGYTGHVYDAVTGLNYMQQRYYDPAIGRFLSRDPVPALKGPFNRYWYGNANPYKFTDPDGRQVSAPKSCHSDNSCIPLDQVNRGDATMMKVVAVPIVVGGTAGVATATGATAATVSTTGRVATAAEAKYTATAIAAVEKGRAAAQTVATKVTEVGQAVATKATELVTQAMTSNVAVASMKYREQLTDAFEGMVGHFFGVEGPAKSSYELGGEAAAEAVIIVTDSDPEH